MVDGGDGGRAQRRLQGYRLQRGIRGLDCCGREGELYFAGQYVLWHDLLIGLRWEIFEFVVVIWREYQCLIRQGKRG